MHCLGGRVLKPEILDTLPYDEARASLGDLTRLNRYWGGHGTLRKLLRNAVTDDEFSLLDIGAASGDMGRCVREWYPKARVTSLDRIAFHLAAPPALAGAARVGATPALAGAARVGVGAAAARPGVAPDGARVAGDAFSLPFRAKSFDFAFSSLFLHHFTNEEIVKLFAEFGRVARRAVLAIDLDRNPIAYYFVPWTRWIFGWDPVTVNDAAISVEAAFHPEELETLAARAGLKHPRARVYRPAFRIAMIANVA